MSVSKHLCSAQELIEKLDDNHDNLVILDASWYLPSEQIDSAHAFNHVHIPNAVFFDIDEVCDQQSNLPHMLPSAAHFAAAVGNLGISNDSDVVVYDTAGIFSAARVWWMFHVFGHSKVRVLNGGLPAWLQAGGGVTSEPSKPHKTEFDAHLNHNRLASKDDLVTNCKTEQYLVLDARPESRFLGQSPEPRPGLPSGHMPASKSLPFSCLLDNGHLKTQDQLHSIFNKLEANSGASIITSCGSGVTAAIITLALAGAGLGMHRLYDGAWAEWSSSTDTEILSG